MALVALVAMLWLAGCPQQQESCGDDCYDHDEDCRDSGKAKETCDELLRSCLLGCESATAPLSAPPSGARP
jgi:hypothetical protein